MTDDFNTLAQQIGNAFIDAAPSDWEAGELVFRQVGKTGEFTAIVTRSGGAREQIALGSGGMRPFRKMRTLMSQPGKGAWFTATCRIQAPSKIDFDFDYDHEPAWGTAISVGHYLEEWDKHPRDRQHTPEWLERRLEEARAWESASS